MFTSLLKFVENSALILIQNSFHDFFFFETGFHTYKADLKLANNNFGYLIFHLLSARIIVGGSLQPEELY